MSWVQNPIKIPTMDPASIVGLVASCLSLAEKAVKTIHGGWELYTKFKDAEQSVGTLVMRLETIQSALVVLKSWIQSYLSKQDAAIELVRSLERAIRGCFMVLTAVQELVEGLENKKTREKICYLWNEATINSQAGNLDSQVNALNLVVGIMQLYV